MGYNIRKVRESMGLTQEELAEKSSVSRTIISGLESGRVTTTTTDTLRKIAEALGKPISAIFFSD